MGQAWRQNIVPDSGLKSILVDNEEWSKSTGRNVIRMLSRLQLAMDGEDLTEQETALYDRQIRVWGADAQRRLSKAHVLVYGMNGSVAETAELVSYLCKKFHIVGLKFCKNIVLAGVGSLTLVDDGVATKYALSSNFLIPLDENNNIVYSGKTLAELCCDSLKVFNPMVHVAVGKGNFSTFGDDFFNKFHVVVVSCCSLAAKKQANNKCRKLSKRVAFYTVDCRDSCAEVFVDLQDYGYSKKISEKTIECQLQYPSFEEAVSVPWRSLPMKTSKLYFAMRVIEKYEEAEGRKPGEISIADLPGVMKLKKELCSEQSVSESHVPDNLLERLVTNTTEFPPVCAIIGGIIGQEVIKAISDKGEPLKNFFFFDALDGKGIIEDISDQNA